MLHAYKIKFSISGTKYNFLAEPNNILKNLKEKYLKIFNNYFFNIITIFIPIFFKLVIPLFLIPHGIIPLYILNHFIHLMQNP